MSAAGLTPNELSGQSTPPAVEAPAEPSPEVAARQRKLDKSLLHGIAWSGGIKYLSQFLSWCSALVVTRLLTPADYGLVAMATVYLGLITLVSEFGVGAAVVTLRDLKREQIQQLNSFSVLLGLTGFVISIFAAFPLSWFFHAPKLPPVVIVMSLAFVINSFKCVPAAMLEREMRFKSLSLVDGMRALILAIGSMTFAILGFRYWTLVMGAILSATVSTTMMLRINRERFRFPRWDSLRRALTFSWHILGGRISWYLYSNSDFAVAGRVLGQVPLGNYTVAWTLANIPLQSVSNLVSSVTPSLFSAVQKDKRELRRYLLNLTEGLALITFPLTTGLALVAHPFVLVFLGAKWLPMVTPLQLLALYASVRSITPLLSPILNVTGDARYGMRIGFLTLLMFPAAFLIGSHWGTAGIAAAWMVVHPLTMSFIFRRVFWRLELSRWEYLKAVRPAIEAIAVMMASVIATKILLRPYHVKPVLGLAAQVSVGALAYIGTMFLFHRDRIDAMWARFKQARRSE
jgi:O-antigen/teichoic acid export membrane protein